MKHFYSLLFLITSILFIHNVNAQTFVTTIPQQKNVVLEEYTGIHCGYCPDGHARAQALSDANPNRVVLVNIHAGGYAVPNAGEPDFRTEFGDNLVAQANVSGYPSGTVNRHVFPEIDPNKTSMSRSAWFFAALKIFPQKSVVNVGFQSQFDTTTRVLTVTVEAYYTDNSPKSTNYLNIVLLENHVFGYQTDYGNGNTNNYDHKHIFRSFMTGQWGDEITTTSQGSFFTKVYSDTIPADWNINNCDVAVFVAESHQEIYTGVQDVAVNGSNDGSTEIYIGEFSDPSIAVKKSSASQAVTFDMAAISSLANSSDFDFSLTSNAPVNWTASYNIKGNDYTTNATISLDNGTNESISISVTPGGTPAFAEYTLTMSSVSNPTAGTKEIKVYVVSGVTDLIVNNSSSWGDGSDTMANTFQQFYTDGLDNANNTTYGITNSNVYMLAESNNALTDIEAIYYNVGWSFPSLSDELASDFSTFLTNGGNLMISGQDIGWDNWDDNGYGTANTKAFIQNYLHANFINDGSPSDNLLISAGDELYGDIGNSALINRYGKSDDGNAYMYPDRLAVNGQGVPILKYSNSKIAAIRSHVKDYKTVYLGFSLEMISDDNIRNEVMTLTHDWFHGKITLDVFDEKMKTLNSNYPNPANDYTIIPLRSFKSKTTLQIMDTKGRIIIEKIINSGNTEVRINTSSIDNGIYFYKIISENKIIDSKAFQIIH
ncbi:MAG: Omp28-related outer membrane protein [Bacteroidota bacterium]|nr:Omp28-related outer membrane protein [Bacteroidota bacterium]